MIFQTRRKLLNCRRLFKVIACYYTLKIQNFKLTENFCIFTGPDVPQDIPQQITFEEEERNMKRKCFAVFK